MCSKRTYVSKSDAKRHARMTETVGARHGSKVGRIDVYRCDECGRFHVGHNRYRRNIGDRDAM